jgi:hypothetical protein
VYQRVFLADRPLDPLERRVPTWRVRRATPFGGKWQLDYVTRIGPLDSGLIQACPTHTYLVVLRLLPLLLHVLIGIESWMQDRCSRISIHLA